VLSIGSHRSLFSEFQVILVVYPVVCPDKMQRFETNHTVPAHVMSNDLTAYYSDEVFQVRSCNFEVIFSETNSTYNPVTELTQCRRRCLTVVALLVQDRDLKFLQESHQQALKQYRQRRSREDHERLEVEHMEQVCDTSQFYLGESAVM